MSNSNFHFLILFLIVSLPQVSAQLTLESYEKEILSPMFDSSKEKGFSKIIEAYEDLGTTREWSFDEMGRVVKELDFRESGISSSINGEPFGSVRSNFKQYIFRYDSKNEISQVHHTVIINDDTLQTERRYRRSSTSVVQEISPVVINEHIETKSISTTYLSNETKDSIITISITRGSGLEYEYKTKTLFQYYPSGLLNQEFYYYNVSDVFEGEKSGEEEYKFSSIRNYVYEEKERLSRVEDLEIDEDGKQIPNSVVTYEYFEDSNRIKGVKIDYYRSEEPEHADISVEYDEKGNPSQLKSDFGNVHYKYEYKS